MQVKQLNIIVEAFGAAMSSVAWVGVLTIMALYMFGILGQGVFGNSQILKERHPEIARQFSTVPRAMCSLLQVMTFDAWVSMMAAQIGEIYPVAWVYFIAFVVLVALGLLNLLMGVFLKSLTDLTEEHRKRDAAALGEAKETLLEVIDVCPRMA
jgi:voltage-gated sodium channel